MRRRRFRRRARCRGLAVGPLFGSGRAGHRPASPLRVGGKFPSRSGGSVHLVLVLEEILDDFPSNCPGVVRSGPVDRAGRLPAAAGRKAGPGAGSRAR